MASSVWRMLLGLRRARSKSACLPIRQAVCHVLVFINVQVVCSLLLILTFALKPTLGAPSDVVSGSKLSDNLSKKALANVENSIGSSDSNAGLKAPYNSNTTNNITNGQRLFNSQFRSFPSLKSLNEINNTDKSKSDKNQTILAADTVGSSIQIGRKKPSGGATDANKTVGSRSAQNPVSGRREIKREFPVALVTAASVAAFCILLFFLLAYIWHTRQLDSRARKLAIRLAADAEDERRGIGRCVSSCRNCGPSSRGRMASSSSSGRYTLAPPLVRPDSVSSYQDKRQYEPLTCTSTSIAGGLGIDTDGERGLGPDSISGRSSVGVSESDAGDSEDVFEPATTLPVIPPDRLRGLRSGGRGAHRKWSRSKKSSCSGSQSLEKRDSAVTDKEILTHFASRRHSTFFI